jgi:polyhydroxybutyrate depolymerase
MPQICLPAWQAVWPREDNLRKQRSDLMKLVRVVPLLLLLAVSASARKSTDDSNEEIRVGAATRSYLLHVPRTLPHRPVPLVLVFHGGGGHASNMPRFTKFDADADANGFIVAYPESFNKSWSDTRGLSPADDIGFIRALIAHLLKTQDIDSKRVYATGISNGGFFSQRLACDLTDEFAAVASVAATMPETLFPLCKPSRPISVMFMHGTKDPIVHIDGGTILRDRGNNVSLAEASAFWRNWDQTSSQPETEDIPDHAHDGTTVRRDTYSHGKQGTEVVIYTIEGGGHTWPGGSQYLPKFIVGKASHNLDATEAIWQFFKRH